MAFGVWTNCLDGKLPLQTACLQDPSGIVWDTSEEIALVLGEGLGP